MYRTHRPWEPLRPGMNWDDGDRGGWDEMFPTITPSACPDKPWQHITFPDHGEVWNRPWRYTCEGEGLCMEIDGVELPYTLRKTLTLTGNRLLIAYELVNRAAAAFSYLWAAHPLLQVEPGMKLHTIPAAGAIQLTYSHGGRLGSLHAMASYPLARTQDGGITDLSTLEGASSGHAEKYYFTEPLQEGYAAISDPVSGAGIVFRFSPEEIPYLAIWAHYGAFGDYTFAPEPATGYLDSVQEAYNRGKVKQVAGGETATWRLEVCLESNSERLEQG
ncbi:DUF4432 family protein [Paenibacillus sp. 1P07SE]|uniref:DUF4432 family protein n=1 Tax=Paenibacillus sp. 1P07SE TaxID=3132209 RepID=UPI0039A75EBE